ncbi:hypothetical protein CRUP_012044, partial [Coryphaenoides rupestris]
LVVREVREPTVPGGVQDHREPLVRRVDVSELQLVLGGGDTSKQPAVTTADQNTITNTSTGSRVLGVMIQGAILNITLSVKMGVSGAHLGDGLQQAQVYPDQALKVAVGETEALHVEVQLGHAPQEVAGAVPGVLPEDPDPLGVALAHVQGQLVAVGQLGRAAGPQNHQRHVLQLCGGTSEGHEVSLDVDADRDGKVEQNNPDK